MKFMEAVKAMNEGKKVKRIRKQRNPGEYFVGFDGFGKMGEGRVGIHNGYNSDHTLTIEEIRATDWEIMRFDGEKIEEKKTLSDKKGEEILYDDYGMCLDCKESGMYKYTKFCRKCGKPMTQGKFIFKY